MKKWREISTFGMPLAYIMGFVCVDSLIRLMAGYDWFSLKAILFSISFSSLLAAIGLLFKGIARPIFYSMTFSLISIIAVGQLIYYRFYQAFFSVNQMTNLMELSTVSGEIFRVLELKYSLYLIPTG
ncbi:LTA synthase family protein, partial [Turicibacter sanguinis]|nr:LTA synthase family protein [Turicibacter sanguinis]